MMLSGFCFSLKKNVCERFLCPMPLKSSPTISYSSISFHSSINQAQPYHYEGVPKRLICLFVCFFLLVWSRYPNTEEAEKELVGVFFPIALDACFENLVDLVQLVMERLIGTERKTRPTRNRSMSSIHK